MDRQNTPINFASVPSHCGNVDSSPVSHHFSCRCFPTLRSKTCRTFRAVQIANLAQLEATLSRCTTRFQRDGVNLPPERYKPARLISRGATCRHVKYHFIPSTAKANNNGKITAEVIKSTGVITKRWKPTNAHWTCRTPSVCPVCPVQSEDCALKCKRSTLRGFRGTEKTLWDCVVQDSSMSWASP